MTPILAGLLLLGVSAAPAEQACRPVHVTGYNRHSFSPWTADGTSIYADEPIAAASYDVAMGSTVHIPALGRTLVVHDRGLLGNGNPTWIDIATESDAEAYALTGDYCAYISAPGVDE